MAATERQALAITTHDRSMVVTAGAGTGRRTSWYGNISISWRPGASGVPEILALTYTEKAAAEMKDGSGRTCRPGQFWERAAEEFLVAPVQTFHSFCAQILREFPIEAGLEPGFAILDEQQMARIHEESFVSLIPTPGDGPSYDALVQVLSIIEPWHAPGNAFCNVRKAPGVCGVLFRACPQ